MGGKGGGGGGNEQQAGGYCMHRPTPFLIVDRSRLSSINVEVSVQSVKSISTLDR